MAPVSSKGLILGNADVLKTPVVHSDVCTVLNIKYYFQPISKVYHVVAIKGHRTPNSFTAFFVVFFVSQ